MRRVNDATRYLMGEHVEEWRLVMACKRFTKRVMAPQRKKNRSRLDRYWIDRVRRDSLKEH